MRVEQFLRESAAQYGDKEALIAGGQRLTYGEIDVLSDRLAGLMRARGVKAGDRVIIFMDNCWQSVVSIFAALKAGAVFSPVNHSTKAEKLGYILNDCRASAVITQKRLGRVAKEAVEAAPSVHLMVLAADGELAGDLGAVDFEAAIETSPVLPRDLSLLDVDLAMLIYTSGSTGAPKGVMMTHQNVVAAATSITTYLENSADDIILSVLPLSFDYGLYQILMAFKVGATVVLEKSFTFPQQILNLLSKEKATGFPIVPTMAAILLQLKQLRPGMYPHLRYMSNTAAALPPDHIMKLQDLFPDTDIFSMYGLTECKRCTWLPPHELKKRPTSVGIAIPNSQAMIVDDAGQPVPAGAIGELVIRGAHVMKGYWENEEATNRALRPGPHPWENVLYTGDLFRADEEGFLFFVARKDDIIKTRGEKVSPLEVERTLYALEGIKEVAVIALPDPILGHAIGAAIVCAEGVELSTKEVLRHCALHLEDFMVPKSVLFREELPKTNTGKINHRLLREEAGSSEKMVGE